VVSPHGVVLGASGLIFGWMGYLLARAYFSRKLKWIVVAVLVLFFFGTLLGSLLPTFGASSPWEGNACGFAAGVGAAALLHPRKRRRTEPQAPRTPAVS
jgi:membrane associated rhomboid family serine protease